MAKRLFSHDPVSHVTKWWHDNDLNDECVLETVQDSTELMEENAAIYSTYNGPKDKWGDITRVARIPNTEYFRLMQEGKLYDRKYMTTLLNSSEYRKYRTRPGRVDIRIEK